MGRGLLEVQAAGDIAPAGGQRVNASIAKRRLARIAWWEERGVPMAEAVWVPNDPALAALRTCFADTRKRAKARGLAFTITWAQAAELYEMQQRACSLTGLPFSIERVAGASRRPFAPSFDRRNCAEGYVPRNVRLVCVAVNLAMNEWGLDVLRQISAALLEKTPAKK